MGVNFISAIQKMKGPFKITICSQGGSAPMALAMVSLMQAFPHDIETVAYGVVESAATLILAAGDSRKISSACTFMHHEDSGELAGTASTLEDYARKLKMQDRLWNEKMEEFTKKDAAWWYEQAHRRDTTFSAKELLTFGVVDEIVD